MFDPKISRYEKINFLSKIDIGTEDECWPWCGAKKRSYGHGHVRIQNKYFISHRLMYYLYHGPFDKNKFILHTCNNPECCNPYYLKLGDHKENMQDMKTSDRHKGSGNGASTKLTEEKVRAIKQIVRDRPDIKKGQIAKLYEISPPTLSDIINGRTWQHVEV